MWKMILGISGMLLLFGYIVDVIAKKRSINLKPDEGAKHASDSEQIYMETYLNHIHDNHQNPLS